MPVSKLPGIGEAAPDFELPAVGGGTVCLETQPKPVALVFIRCLA